MMLTICLDFLLIPVFGETWYGVASGASSLLFIFVYGSFLVGVRGKTDLPEYTIDKAREWARRHSECSHVVDYLVKETEETQDIQKLKEYMDDCDSLFATRRELGLLKDTLDTLEHLPHRIYSKEKEISSLERKLQAIYQN